MHAIAWNSLRASQKVSSRQACRIIAGVRCPPAARKFHRSAISYRASEEPPAGSGLPVEDIQGKDETKKDETKKEETKKDENEATSATADNPVTATEAPAKDGEKSSATRRLRTRTEYGSAANRSKRNQKNTGMPPVVLPSWFATRNIKLVGEENKKLMSWEQEGKLAGGIGKKDLMSRIWTHAEQTKQAPQEHGEQEQAQQEHSQTEHGQPEQSLPEQSQPGGKDKASPVEEVQANHDVSSSGVQVPAPQKRDPPTEAKEESIPHYEAYPRHMPQTYSLEREQLAEILAVLTADLVIAPPAGLDPKNINKPTTLLLCPKNGGMLFLDAVVEEVARELRTDLLRLDPDTLAEIIGKYIGESLPWTSRQNIASLGYQAQDRAGRLGMIEPDLEETVSEDEDDLDKQLRPRPPTKPEMEHKVRGALPPVFEGTLRDALFKLNPQLVSTVHMAEQSPKTKLSTDSQAWNDRKITTAFEAFLDSVTDKREDSLEVYPSVPQSNGLIIQMRDFKELADHPYGSALISKLEEVVKKRWLEGENIVLLGTTSSSNYLGGDFSRYQVEILQSESPDIHHVGRTIVVSSSEGKNTANFAADEREYMRRVNLRHVADMYSQLSGHSAEEVGLNLHQNYDQVQSRFKLDVEDSVWPISNVHRIGTIMVGLSKYQSLAHQGLDAVESDSCVQPAHSMHFRRALDVIESSDELKFAQVKEENKREDDEEESNSESKQSASATQAAQTTKERINKLKEKCDYHERKLLNGVVYPDTIKTSFSDVRAPPETIEALKTLTSLSLVRPEAFTYGVLATDKIPGLLMYGPPGTGKTLLAKAVAKESGATVLDVSGADLFNLYVGEGEKNVRALFSLAKKLTPCVVFIDEADAIFGSRGGESSKRSSHRELINQFLREWDGMNDMSAFIMVATNRPFDLDDAVLRRLPRRLLVDLPTEKDREAILKIHLADEDLDESVSLAKISKDTPYYSGSDLKNVGVAAALACVREENEAAAKHTGDETYVYPPKRTLSKRHFEKALEEISASISEDMTSLTAVRKFDEKYGDRKGRRKRKPAIGFGGRVQTEKDSGAGRVRKIEASS